MTLLSIFLLNMISLKHVLMLSLQLLQTVSNAFLLSFGIFKEIFFDKLLNG